MNINALVDRGRLTVWISEATIEGWKSDRPPQQGAQWIFTDCAIGACLQIKVVYGLTLRQTEGFVSSLFELMRLKEEDFQNREEKNGEEKEKMPVLDYTTLSKRQGNRDIEVKGSVDSESNSEEGGARAIASSLLKDFSEISVIPTSSESLVFDADREALFLFEEVECKAPHRSHVLGGMTGADPALVLPEGYV